MNYLGLKQAASGSKLSANRVNIALAGGSREHEGHCAPSEDQSDAINAFNTEDALKNDVNPVHPIPVSSVFGSERRLND